MKNGLGFFSVLGIMFIGLKLAKAIDWSWWWVLSPFWIPGGIIILLLALIQYLEMKEQAKRDDFVKRYKPRENRFQKRLREEQEKAQNNEPRT